MPTSSINADTASSDEARLRQSLRRCSEETVQAALAYRTTRAASCILPVVTGILERYVDPELRQKLREQGTGLRLIEDLALDSLTMMEIIILVEEVLGVTVSNEEARGLRTVEDIRAFIASKSGGAPAA